MPPLDENGRRARPRRRCSEISPRAGRGLPARLTGTTRSCANKPAPFRSNAHPVGSPSSCRRRLGGNSPLPLYRKSKSPIPIALLGGDGPWSYFGLRRLPRSRTIQTVTAVSAAQNSRSSKRWWNLKAELSPTCLNARGAASAPGPIEAARSAAALSAMEFVPCSITPSGSSQHNLSLLPVRCRAWQNRDACRKRRCSRP